MSFWIIDSDNFHNIDGNIATDIDPATDNDTDSISVHVFDWGGSHIHCFSSTIMTLCPLGCVPDPFVFVFDWISPNGTIVSVSHFDIFWLWNPILISNILWYGLLQQHWR